MGALLFFPFFMLILGFGGLIVEHTPIKKLLDKLYARMYGEGE